MKPCMLYAFSAALLLYAETATSLPHLPVVTGELSAGEALAAPVHDVGLRSNTIYHVRKRSHHAHFLHSPHHHAEVSQQTVALARHAGRHTMLDHDYSHQHWSIALWTSLTLITCLAGAVISCLWSYWAPPEIARKPSAPHTLNELFDAQTIDFNLPESVFGDAVLQFTICGALHSAARQSRVSPPFAAWCRSVLCGMLIVVACFLQVYVSWNLDVKLAQERFGLRTALRQCELPLAASCTQNMTASALFWPEIEGSATPDSGSGQGQTFCCTKDQVCGEVSWRYFCSDRPIVKNLYREPFGTHIWGSMACSFAKVSDTYYEFEDTIYPRWPWLVSCILFLWLCIMAKDVRSTFLLLRAVTSRPKVAFASEQIVQQGKVVEVVGMTTQTCFTILILVVVPKILVVAYVAYVGARLLISTSGVLDLVLDGVALMFLIEADQMLYYGLTGSVMREVLRNSKPFTFHNALAHRVVGLFGYDVSVILVSGAIMLFLIVFFNHTESRFMANFIEAACSP